MAFKVITRSLSAANPNDSIASQQEPITQIAVLALTSGATISLKVGSAEPIPLRQGFIADLCGDEQRVGLTLSYAAQPGASITVVLGAGGVGVR